MIIVPQQPFRPCIMVQKLIVDSKVPVVGWGAIDWTGNEIIPPKSKYATTQQVLKQYNKSDDATQSLDQEAYIKVLEQSKQ